MGLLELLFPRECLSCEAGALPVGNGWLCPECRSLIEPPSPNSCRVCGGELGPSADPASCGDCARLRPKFDGAVAVGRYDGLLGDLVVRMKYGRRPNLAWPLGALLAEAIAAWPEAEPASIVVPMPMRFGQRWRRGFNQAELLAEEVARLRRLPLARFALAHVGGGAPQAGLSRTERLEARRGSFRAMDPAAALTPALARVPPLWRDLLARLLAPRVRGRTALLIDDVLTTGATANDAARALKAVGAASVLVAVVARA